MNKIFSQDTIKNLPSRNVAEIINKFLNSEHNLSRELAILQIALRINENYVEYSKLLLNEMNKDIHFRNDFKLGVKSAWTLAVALIENLIPEDYPKIKKEFDKWDEEEKKDLLDWLKHHPDHCKVLKEGKL